jgi:Skp family chaperone for outer membrane proteins
MKMKKHLLLMAIIAFMIAACGPSASQLEAEAELETRIENLEQETDELDQLNAEIDSTTKELDELLEDI